MKHKIYIIALVVVLLAPVVAFADAPPSPLGTIGPGDEAGTAVPASGDYTTVEGITSRVTELVNWFSWGVALISVVMGLYAGFLFITARGEPAQIKTARGTLLWAIIGIAVAIISFSIITITKTILML